MAPSVAPVTPPAAVVEGVSAVRTLGDTAPSTATPTGTLGSAVKVGAVTAASTAPARGLAFTGMDAAAAAGAGLVLLLAGTGFVILGRRRAGRTA
ncbi:MAG TPA: hypothetical protein VGI06_10620 [Acidimicrobiales bacterium]